MGFWYGVMINNEADDWSCGSYDLAEAEAMLAEFKAQGCDDAYIAVIADGGDPICVDEIRG